MASKDYTFVATFHGATRRNNSVNGNPTWTLHTSEGDFITKTDAALGYDIGNYTNGRTSDSLIGKQVKFTATAPRGGGRGRVWNMEAAK